MALENNYAVVHQGHAFCAAKFHERSKCAFFYPFDHGDVFDESPTWFMRECAHLSAGRCMNQYAKEDALR